MSSTYSESLESGSRFSLLRSYPYCPYVNSTVRQGGATPRLKRATQAPRRTPHAFPPRGQFSRLPVEIGSHSAPCPPRVASTVVVSMPRRLSPLGLTAYRPFLRLGS